MKAAAIIVSGGSGIRFGRDGGKQTATVCGRPLFAWAVEAFARAQGITEIVVVAPAERAEEFARIACEAAGSAVVVTASGARRQDSVEAGLAALRTDADIVAVHDGARPLVTPALVERALGALADGDSDGVVVAHPSVDTVKIVESGRVVATPDRETLWSVQTPQVFRRSTLLQAYDAARESGFQGTDDASFVEHMGGTVAVIEGPRDNIKVTLPEDLAFVEAALRAREEGAS